MVRLLVVLCSLLLAPPAWALVVEYETVITCGAMTPAECTETVLAALGHGPSFKLKADTPTDTVHGSVTIFWKSPPEKSLIRVEVYEVADPPTGGRKSTLARPLTMPKVKEITDNLEKMK